MTGKRVIFGVSGGIAAYKAADLASQLTQRGAAVHVVMTANAQRFVTAETFRALTGLPVMTDIFDMPAGGGMPHVDVAAAADLFAVIPATANVIAKLAHGIADDMLTTMALACPAPLLIAPAMNTNMWEHAATRANLEVLRGRGVHIVPPGEGRLACGTIGPGRLADATSLLTAIEQAVLPDLDLSGRTLLVTAGPTREPLDPVRFLSNRSSGKMGYAIAAAAQQRGARVVLVSGPTNLPPPSGVEFVAVQTAEEMAEAARQHFDVVDAVIGAAAPADFRAQSVATTKIKKESAELALALTKTRDIMAELAACKQRQVLVGFAAETDDVVAHAAAKLRAKQLDLIVANDVTRPGAGFEVDTNIAVLIAADGEPVELPLMSKQELAHQILDRVVALCRARGEQR